MVTFVQSSVFSNPNVLSTRSSYSQFHVNKDNRQATCLSDPRSVLLDSAWVRYVMTWIRFPHYWHCWPMDSHHKGPVMLAVHIHFVGNMTKLINKKSSGRWLGNISCEFSLLGVNRNWGPLRKVPIVGVQGFAIIISVFVVISWVPNDSLCFIYW